jgi:hypothetical protein
MLKLARARISPAATVLLVSFLSLNLPHVGDAHHDPDGAIVVFAHDASAHRVSGNAPEDGAPPQHCVVCHLARSFLPRTEATSLPAPIAEASTRVHVEVFTAPRTALVAQPPLRSPPASPVSLV